MGSGPCWSTGVKIAVWSFTPSRIGIITSCSLNIGFAAGSCAHKGIASNPAKTPIRTDERTGLLQSGLFRVFGVTPREYSSSLFRAKLSASTRGMNLSLTCRTGWQSAVAPLRKAFRFHAKRVVKPRPVVLPGHCRRKFHQLRIRESLPQLGKQRVWHLHGSLRHGIGVLQRQLFHRRKQLAVPVIWQGRDLLYGDPAGSADRRTDINSKRAANERGHSQLREVF